MGVYPKKEDVATLEMFGFEPIGRTWYVWDTFGYEVITMQWKLHERGAHWVMKCYLGKKMTRTDCGDDAGKLWVDLMTNP